MAGSNTAALLTARRTFRSALHSSHVAMCASTRSIASARNAPCNRSGSISLIPVSVQLFIAQKLLYRSYRIVVVNPRRAFGAVHDHRDLLVRQTLLYPQR